MRGDVTTNGSAIDSDAVLGVGAGWPSAARSTRAISAWFVFTPCGLPQEHLAPKRP